MSYPLVYLHTQTNARCWCQTGTHSAYCAQLRSLRLGTPRKDTDISAFCLTPSILNIINIYLHFVQSGTKKSDPSHDFTTKPADLPGRMPRRQHSAHSERPPAPLPQPLPAQPGPHRSPAPRGERSGRQLTASAQGWVTGIIK